MKPARPTGVTPFAGVTLQCRLVALPWLYCRGAASGMMRDILFRIFDAEVLY
jgi:hypothetical protein